MTAEYDDVNKAEGRLRLAMRRAAAAYPFHVRLLEQFRLLPRPEVGTVAVTVSGDDLLLLHNPGFVLKTPADQMVGALLHEVHHVVLGHMLADPAEFPDEWARTIAEEVSANEYIREPLPPGVITLDSYPALPPRESTRQRYARLRHESRRQPINSPRAASPSQASKSRRRGRQRPNPAAAGPATVDDHGVWQEARQDRQRSARVIRDAILRAVLAVAPEGVPPEFEAALAGLGIPGAAEREKESLAKAGEGHVDWRVLLRRYVGQATEVRPTFSRPPRRFPELVGILPGQRRLTVKPNVMAVIDTSGSITTPLLEAISTELGGLARHYTVTVVECDAEIQRAYAYRPIQDVCGGGGTDLRPPLEKDFLRKHRPDVVVYFTDGQGPAPASSPGPPVIWCLAPGGVRPALWGRVILMH